MTTAQQFTAWRQLIIEHPSAYLRHRIDVTLWLLNINDVGYCLPIHIGVAGDETALSVLGMASRNDARNDLIYRWSVSLRNSPWLHHYVSAVLIALAILLSWKRRRETAMQVVLIFASGMGLFVLSMIPLTIACDFRYLYPAIPSISACLLALLSASPRATATPNATHHGT